MTRAPKYVVLNKKRGETPLEALSAWKATHSKFSELPMSYAGRLDPMAEGKLLVLLGEECKKQEKYTKLDKEYEVEVLLGAGTDTRDVLGYVVAQPAKESVRFLNAYETEPTLLPAATLNTSQQHTLPVSFTRTLATLLKSELGNHSRKYPIFSSKTVGGKPLFLYALEGTLDSITIPEHIETIYSITLQGTQQVSKEELHTIINDHLSVVPRSNEPSKALGADFRQDAVREKWTAFFSTTPQDTFVLLKLRVVCGSGSYMRTLAERIGESLGMNALALSIKRTKVGNYKPLFGSVGVWTKSY